MNFKQNQKNNQVKESTLVVGIDIGSTTQYARAFDWRGIELGKVFKFSNSREGFENFKDWMQQIQDRYKKSDAMVGIEPTVLWSSIFVALVARKISETGYDAFRVSNGGFTYSDVTSIKSDIKSYIDYLINEEGFEREFEENSDSVLR